MSDFIYAVSALERDRGGLPDLPVINMFTEPFPAEAKPVLMSRPGLEVSDVTMGFGPVRGLFQIDGVLGNSLFGVSGFSLYSGSTSLGTIDGTGNVHFCGYENKVFTNAGEHIWGYDGTALTTVSFPEDADVASICVGAGRLLAVRKDTGTFYWSSPLTSDIDVLNFATAEQSPDKLKDIMFISDKLVLFGSETVEFWQVTGSTDLPFAPVIGLTFPVGIKQTGAATQFNNSIAWVTNDNNICLGDPMKIISDAGIQKRIQDSTSVTLWTFDVDGEEILALRIEGTTPSTWTLKGKTQTWSKMESYGYDNWLCQCSVHDYFGTSLDGRLLRWSDSYTDLDGILERRFRTWMPINSGGFRLDSIILRANAGDTPYLIGNYTNPKVELRLSKTGGNSWNTWKSRNLGIQGDVKKLTRWNSLGIYSYPGILAEFRVTDPVSFRVSDLVINEKYGGT